VPASIERFGAGFVRAGNWVFGTGLREADPTVLFGKMDRELRKAGSSLARVARLDQYYPDAACVPPYHQARKQAFGPGQIAPSTSVIVSGLHDPHAKMDVQVIAATEASGYVPQPVQAGLNRPDASGYTPVLRVGDLLFVAGQLARDGSGKLAAQGVEEETRYIIERRLRPALEAAGSSLDLILKAQVYVSQRGEVPAFAPATIVRVRHPAFLTREATVEINVIAAHRSARARIRDIKGKARMLDGLMFVHGVHSLDEAKRVLDLSRVVRGLFFHAKGAAPADPGFPYTAIEVESGPVIDLWGYVP